MLSTSPPQPEDQMKGRFLLNVVVSQSPAIFQLLTRKYQALLIRWDPFFILVSQASSRTVNDMISASCQSRR